MRSVALLSLLFASGVAIAGVVIAAPAVPAAPAAPAVTAAKPAPAAAAQPAAGAYDRLKALAGTWVGVEAPKGDAPPLMVTYRLTGAGTTVVETLFPGGPHEMTTMYTRDGGDLVLTHYCAAGNQPRMRAKTIEGNVLRFAFDGGTSLDPAKDSHMHSAWIEFVSADEIIGEWQGWEGGKPEAQAMRFHLKRKAA